eukprot:evm.model.NODE_8710_length_21214_cov_36.574619.4
MPRLDIAVIGSGPCALAFVSRLAAPPATIDLSADFLYGFDSEIESLQTTIGRLNALKKKTNTSSKGHPLQGRVKVFEKSEMNKTVAGSKCEREAFADFKHLRYSGCHRAPSVPLFRSLCTHLRKALDLDSLLEQATVLAIEPVYMDEKTGQAVSHFRLTLCRGHEAPGLIEVIEAT